MKKIELLSPAGDLNRLKAALLYGADAVYVGGQKYSLRANAANLNLDEIKEATTFAHNLNKKVYLTLNIVFHNEDLKEVKDYIKNVVERGIDAFIVSDVSLIKYIKDNFDVEVHVSTQNTTNNLEAAKFLKSLGADRVVLARELSYEEIKEITKTNIVETEVFVHGAICTFYSGRCALSSYFTGRDANRGGCAQVCRFSFNEGENKFSLASKDLNLIDYVTKIADINVSSLKIEGRMRSIYYLATVISAYRNVLDEYYQNKLSLETLDESRKKLSSVANRENTSQYLKGDVSRNDQYYEGREEKTNQEYVLDVISWDGSYLKVIQKNYFEIGDTLEIFNYKKEKQQFKVIEIFNEEMQKEEAARHPKNNYFLKIDQNINIEILTYTMGRKIII